MELDYLVIVLPVVIERVNQVVKRAGMPSRFSPLLGAILGAAICATVAVQQGGDVVLWTLIGLMAGGASGPWHDVVDRLPIGQARTTGES